MLLDALLKVFSMAQLEEQKETKLEIPKETLDFFGGDELRARVFYEKYALRDELGRCLRRPPLRCGGVWRGR